MDSLVKDPAVGKLWSYFAGLSKIPRGSKVEAAAADWVAEQGRALGCAVERDSVGNVLIKKKASSGREGRPGIVLQAHVDMVCEKNEGTDHDFTKDPIALVRKDDHVTSRGTTLGADNGIGVAAALAVLASDDLKHGPLEVLVTVDEESGMTGAKGLGEKALGSKYLINLDSEEEGRVTIGCAGGMDTIARKKLTLVPAPAGAKAYRLKVFGLKGGHSADAIGSGRGNAIRLAAQLASAFMRDHGVALASIAGGNKRNAIPREAFVVFFADPALEAKLRADVSRHEAAWKLHFGVFEPELAFALEKADAAKAIAPADARTLVDVLLSLPSAVEAMNPALAGATQTSTNMGVVTLADGVVEIHSLSRSSVDSSKLALVERLNAVYRLAGYDVTNGSGYAAWRPDPESSLLKLVQAAHETAFGKPLKVSATHGGLECGLIGAKHEGMEMVSFGPDMWDVHTPDERVSVPSVANFWKFLKTVLESI